MSRRSRNVDRSSFVVRREARDILTRLLARGQNDADGFARDMRAVQRGRHFALRHLLRLLATEQPLEEVTALEVLGRLTLAADLPALARVVNDSAAAERARVACGLVLLGRDRPDLIRASDISGLILRWQAQFIAEAPVLHRPLTRLYRSASRRERASWIVLQDRELNAPEGRAAVFEMLLEVEPDPDLRALLLDALARTPGPWSRAALRRCDPRSPEERDTITAALASLAAAADGRKATEGWVARVGFCDGAGSFALRFDFRAARTRPRSALFVLNIDSGVREALALCGVEVQRYDQLDQDFSDGAGSAANRGLIHPVPVPVALALLSDAERSDRRENRAPPQDYARARRLLDALADTAPEAPPPADAPLASEAAARSEELFGHPGYAGWFYDAGDHLLDDLRLAVLRSGQREGPDETLVTEAAERLARAGEPRRIARMLRHNAFVHRAAGEHDWAELALAAVGAIAAGGFASLPLVRQMVRESLHPGHYFFTPLPDAPERLDIAGWMVGEKPPSKVRVLAIDLGLMLSRAVEVWLSRVPSQQRPHSDQVQRTVLALAQTGARTIAENSARIAAIAETGRSSGFAPAIVDMLRRRYLRNLQRTGFPRVAVDPAADRLLEALVAATEALVTRVCLSACGQRCPCDPRGSGRQALPPRRFPAGPEAELFIRTWPGVFVREPSPAERSSLAALLGRSRLKNPWRGESHGPAQPFRCALCNEERPAGARSRLFLLPHENSGPRPVCRRCLNRYRKEASFRAEVIARQGRLV